MKTIGFYVSPGFQMLDLAGPAGAFEAASRELGRPAYRITVLAAEAGAVTNSLGMTIAATSGDRVRADRSVGADRLLRFLALVEAVETPAPNGANPPDAKNGNGAPPPSSVPGSGPGRSIGTADLGPPSDPSSGLRNQHGTPVKS